MCFRRDERQVPLAGGPRQAAGRPRQRLAARRASAPAPSSRATGSTTSATAARLSAPTCDGLANGNQGVQDEKYKGPKDADILWRLDMIEKLGVFPHNLATCSPLIVGDTLFVITSNGVDEGHINIPVPEAPSFLAIDKKTGKVLWQDNSPSATCRSSEGRRRSQHQEAGEQGPLLMHGQWSNPVYAEPNGKPMIIFPGGDGWVRAFDPKTGKLLWKFDCNPKDADLRPRRLRARATTSCPRR